MAEQLRNEVDIQLGGETRTMRATFSAVRAIERELGKGIMRIINDLGAHGDLSVTDMAVVVHQGLKGYGDTSMTFDQVGDAMLTEGFDKCATAAMEFLAMALKGPSMGKPQPEAAGQ